jgi:D-alanyl-D-alanine carboxypeptidase/D-alanyl-D-alanine-endopeptidase (penicillin-binding protein 4)
MNRFALATYLLASAAPWFGPVLEAQVSRPPSVSAAPTLPPALKRKVDSWYSTTARRTGGSWGIAITDERGNLLWGKNTDRAMIPASTVKIFSTAYALAELGGDFTRQTRVLGVGTLDSTTGQWIGTWQLQLNGDPTLEDPQGMGPRLYDLAAQLAAQGIRTLSGPMFLTTAEPQEATASFPSSWRLANWGSIYAPLIGPVTLHENIVELLVMPGGRIGARPRIARDAPLGIKDLIVNEATTRSGRGSRLRLVPLRDGRIALRGWTGHRAGMRQVRGAVADPRKAMEVAWAAVLSQAGIQWERGASTMVPTASARAQVLAEVSSPRLDSIVAMVNRRSLNIGAELLLHWAAGWEAPAESLQAHVLAVTEATSGLRLRDGSGLSHDDRVTPRLMAAYLARIPTRSNTEMFPFLLPANGAGTLARLRGGFADAGVVRAKTGTLSGVSSLAGYLGRREGTYIVVTFFNGGRTRRARAAQWQLFRVIGGGGVRIPVDTDFGPEVVADTNETPEPTPPVPVTTDSGGSAGDPGPAAPDSTR